MCVWFCHGWPPPVGETKWRIYRKKGHFLCIWLNENTSLWAKITSQKMLSRVASFSVTQIPKTGPFTVRTTGALRTCERYVFSRNRAVYDPNDRHRYASESVTYFPKTGPFMVRTTGMLRRSERGVFSQNRAVYGSNDRRVPAVTSTA